MRRQTEFQWNIKFFVHCSMTMKGGIFSKRDMEFSVLTIKYGNNTEFNVFLRTYPRYSLSNPP